MQCTIRNNKKKWQDKPRLVKDRGKTPQGGNRFKFFFLLDFHKMFTREYNKPIQQSKSNFDYPNRKTNIQPIMSLNSQLWSIIKVYNFVQVNNSQNVP